jgi:hypothetical protein
VQNPRYVCFVSLTSDPLSNAPGYSNTVLSHDVEVSFHYDCDLGRVAEGDYRSIPSFPLTAHERVQVMTKSIVLADHNLPTGEGKITKYIYILYICEQGVRVVSLSGNLRACVL